MAEKILYRVNLAFFKGIYHLINFFSEKTLRAFSSFIAKVSYSLGIRKDVVKENLRYSFPEWNEEKIDKIARATYIHFAYIFLEFLRFPNWDKRKFRERIKIKSPETFKEFEKNTNGKIVISGHLGSWELLAAYYSKFYTSAGIVKRQNNAAANDFFADIRRRSGLNIFFMKESMELGVPWLKEGKILMIAGDQDARHHGIFVDFMGRKASTYVGLAVFAKRAKADIYFTSAIRNDEGGYDLYLEKMFEAKDGFGDDFIPMIIQKYMNRLEFYVRRHPEQYFWLHKRWKTRPPDENA